MTKGDIERRALNLANTISQISNRADTGHLAIASNFLNIAVSLQDMNLAQRFIRFCQIEISRAKQGMVEKDLNEIIKDIDREPTVEELLENVK